MVSSFLTTSEALIYGEEEGLSVEKMLNILNKSSGQNFCSAEIVPKYVLTENYDGFRPEAYIVEKGLRLFISAAKSKKTQNSLVFEASSGVSWRELYAGHDENLSIS